MARKTFGIVVRKGGESTIASYPVYLEPGDQFLMAQEVAGSEVPVGSKWRVSGYSRSGPIITEVD